MEAPQLNLGVSSQPQLWVRMASSIGHAAAALAIGAALRPAGRTPRRFWWLAAAAGVLPDVDALGRPFGAGDLAWLGGHRAFSHSLVFAALLAIVLAAMARRTVPRDGEQPDDASVGRLWLAFALAGASHGLLDTLTAYGEGVALLAPMSWARFSAPWHPLDPAAAADGHAGPAQLLDGLVNEAAWIWLPALAVGMSFGLARRYFRQRSDVAAS